MATAQERITTVAAGKTIPPRAVTPAPVNMDALRTALIARLQNHWLGELDGMTAGGVSAPGIGMFKNVAALLSAFAETFHDTGIGFHFYARGLIGCTISYFGTHSGKVVRVLGSMSDQGNYAQVSSAVLYNTLGTAVAALTADINALEALVADVNEAGTPEL